MNRCDILRGITNDCIFSELMFDIVQKSSSKENLLDTLTKSLEESELQTIMSIAQSGYPLSLERIQK